MNAFLYAPIDAYLRYLDLPGEEPAIVYLAGLGLAATGSYPRVVCGSPLSRYRAIIPDSFGSGFSDHPDQFGYTISGHAEVLAQLLDHLQLSACTLVGHSMGGSVAISLANQRPELAASLILAESNLDPGGGNFSRAITAYSEQDFIERGYQELDTAFREEIRQGDRSAAVAAGMWQVADPRALHRSAVSLVQCTEPSWRQVLYQMTIPRAFLFGADSLPDPDFETLPAHGIKVAVIPRAGHGMVWENPDDFASAVARLVASA